MLARSNDRSVERSLAPVCVRARAAGSGRLEVERGGRWFRRDGGAAVDCARRPVLRALLAALARARVDSPGRPVPGARLLEAGWPGQRMRPASARRRLQVAVSRLRELGLAGALVSAAGGYLVTPAIEVAVVDGSISSAGS